MEAEKRDQRDVSVSVCGMHVRIRRVCAMHACVHGLYARVCVLCVCVPLSETLTLGGNFFTCPSSWEPMGRVLCGPQRFERVRVIALLLSSCVAVNRLPTGLASASSSVEWMNQSSLPRRDGQESPAWMSASPLYLWGDG